MATSNTNQNSTDVWGKGSVRSYGAINGPNQAAPIRINLQANPRHATPRPILSRSVNNQDVEAALRIDPAENSAQSLSDGQRMALCIAISFFTILIFAFLFCLLMWSVGCCTDL